MSSAPVRWIRSHPVAAFAVLTVAITWSFWIPSIQFANRPTTSPNAALAFGLQTLGVLGPLGGAAIVSWATGDFGAWVARLTTWRVARRWWTAAVVVPLGVLALTVGSFVLLGGTFDAARLLPLAVLPILLLQAFVRGGLEEPGWRGFAQPALQERHGAFGAALLVGLVWFVWHAPLFLLSGSQQAGGSTLTYGASLLALSVLLAALYNSTGSVLPAVLFHTVWNGAQVWVTTGTLRGDPAVPADLVVLVLLWGLVVFLVGFHGTRRLASRKAPVFARPAGRATDYDAGVDPAPR